MITRYCLICIFLCVTCLTNAQPVTQTADSLYQAGHYLEAGVAYERVLFKEKDEGLVFAATLGKVQCLKQRGRYEKAVDFLNGQLPLIANDSLLFRLRQEQVLCAYLAGQFENTLSLADRLGYLHPTYASPTLLLVVRLLSLNELHRWPEAANVYRQLIKQVGNDSTAASPYAQLPRLKNPKKAQWLATFIPGAGQFYAGRPGEAILSILVQSAGLYFGVTSFLDGYYISAWGVGVALFGSFHAGGIRRSEALVNQYNDKKIRLFNAQVKGEVLQLIAHSPER